MCTRETVCCFNHFNMTKTVWCFLLYIWYLTSLKNIEAVIIDRQPLNNIGKTPISIDKFTNKGNRTTWCFTKNAMCENSTCVMCVCRNFDTFLSYEHGCLNVSLADKIVERKHKGK